MRWDNVVDKVWKETANQEDILPMQKFGGCKTEEKKDRQKGKARVKKRWKGTNIQRYYLRDIRGIKKRNRIENVFARPNGLQLRLCEGNLDLSERRKRY